MSRNVALLVVLVLLTGCSVGFSPAPLPTLSPLPEPRPRVLTRVDAVMAVATRPPRGFRVALTCRGGAREGCQREGTEKTRWFVGTVALGAPLPDAPGTTRRGPAGLLGHLCLISLTSYRGHVVLLSGPTPYTDHLTRPSEKEQASPTFKKTFGFHPLAVWGDNTTEFLAGMLRTGKAGSNTAVDHITVLGEAIAQVPAAHHKKLLVRCDGAGASHDLSIRFPTLPDRGTSTSSENR